MASKTKEKWAVRVYLWREGVDRSADEDVADQQEEFWTPVKSLKDAIRRGPTQASHGRIVTPDSFDVMRGTPDAYSAAGYDWRKVHVAEDV
jgi:hypothetical protein